MVAAVAAVAGYATAGSSGAEPATEPSSATGATLRGVVQSLSGDSLRLRTSAGESSLKLADATVFEAARPAHLADVRPGDWLNVGAVAHAQTIFAIVSVTIIPESILAGTPP